MIHPEDPTINKANIGIHNQTIFPSTIKQIFPTTIKKGITNQNQANISNQKQANINNHKLNQCLKRLL
jgi:hypothetical protein